MFDGNVVEKSKKQDQDTKITNECIVYVWNENPNLGNVGHASIQIGNDKENYLSLWPTGNVKLGNPIGKMLPTGAATSLYENDKLAEAEEFKDEHGCIVRQRRAQMDEDLSQEAIFLTPIPKEPDKTIRFALSDLEMDKAKGKISEIKEDILTNKMRYCATNPFNLNCSNCIDAVKKILNVTKYRLPDEKGISTKFPSQFSKELEEIVYKKISEPNLRIKN